MVIRSKALRVGLLVSTFVVVIIIALQLYWLKTVYIFEEGQFSTNISRSIKGLYEDMNLDEAHSYNIEKLVETPGNDLFLAKVNSLPDIDTLKLAITNELETFRVFTDCKIATYDSRTAKYTAEKYIDLPDIYRPNADNADIPVLKRDYSYIALFFPHRGQYIIKQMFFWIVSSGILLLALIGFSSSVFYLYRQKFLNETQKDFVNNFTHEFKTPLSVIKIAADVLQQPTIIEKPEKFKRYAGIITEQTTHLQKQVQRLLEIAFTDQRYLPLVMERFNMNELIRQALNDLQPLIEEKKVQISTSYTDQNAVILADKTHMLLVVINLVENAIKYSVHPAIKIVTYTEDGNFCIQVQDNGMGIAQQHQKKIFDRFYRITNGNLHTAKGFGLGLNFVKKIIDAHSGKIDVQSEPGKGSMFTIKLPKKV